MGSFVHTFEALFFFSKCYPDPLQVSAILGQLHDDAILVQLPECFSLMFSCANLKAIVF